MTEILGIEVAAASNDLEAARATAQSLGGGVYFDDRDPWQHLPFRALVTSVTDDIETLQKIADVGLYVVCRRLVKPGPFEVAGLFPLVHHPDMTRRQADSHWRDNHGPLALEHHRAMSHYTQLAVLHRIAGLEIDGFAVCGFETLEDLRDRFFSLPDSQEVINADVNRFADTKRSPRRLIARFE